MKDVPDNVDALIVSGMSYFKLGNYQQALEAYNKALDLNPNFADGYINRSIVCTKLGNYEQVKNDIKTMFSMDIFKNDYISTFQTIQEILSEENSDKSMSFLKEIEELEKEIPNRFSKKETVQ